MVDEFYAVLFLEKKRTNSGPCMESTSKHSIYTPAGASVPQGLTMFSMQLFGGAVHQGAVRLLPELALGRRAGGHVQSGEVSPQEEGRTRKKVLEQGGRDGAIRDAPASVRRPLRRPVMTSRRP